MFLLPTHLKSYSPGPDARNMASPCGCATVYTKVPRVLKTYLDKMHTAACRTMVSPSLYNDDIAALIASRTIMLDPGVGWIIEERVIRHMDQTGYNIHGWMTMKPIVNTADRQYKAMISGFNKHWLKAFKEGFNKGPAVTKPSAGTPFAWNAVIAIANTLTKLFDSSDPTSPPTYPTNPTFQGAVLVP